MKKPPSPSDAPVKLRVGIVLMPNFTLTAFAGFIDALRLAADEGDHSRPIHCHWDVMAASGGDTTTSSCGVRVGTSTLFKPVDSYDYIVVVGGVLHGGQRVSAPVGRFLKQAAASGVKLVGLCTGSFVLARAGLLRGHLACVSWFHRDDFEAAFPDQHVVSSQMFVVDRDRLTCAGGTSVVHLAAHIIELALGRASAVKALRILIEEQPLPSKALQPEAVVSERATDPIVHKAMLLLEQQLQVPAPINRVCAPLGLGQRQLERRFQHDIGLTPAQYRQQLRLERARWLLQHSALGLQDIALECGFTSGAHLARLVQRELGQSPRAIRTGKPQARATASSRR
ncbi:GlxA family transcriptional regulator [Pseudoxanthomonas sp.]|uniref:GlxA family transcriptional regulator n=1 Tax=Pseudoxanthomonas sp. TaxID=1871049 RepID=UPI002637F3CF|nr:GlxA family transcriptional regulator [Pseudoxanthomonas sp.]WDS37444.1 MAG: GlxA family transcriptional regulator [Pseudoxanthomonas sp.]